ncbi:MAG: Uma2 family endonuclease [Treponema sp.]|jgi:Uma2 family endonuclease|nr:Uma2 family endonuclease [Treponema sp.]
MPLAEKQENERYTYADILSWDESERYELLDGEAYMMSSPNRKHQEMLGEIFAQFHFFLKDKPCKVYPAPFGVRLFPKEDNSDDTYFEPDISVICDSSKLDDKGCYGAPDLVIEILSPSTAKYDLLYKLNKYMDAKVREYWVVDPENKKLQVYTLEQDRHIFSLYDADDTAPVMVLPGCSIDLKPVFAD